MHGRTAPSATSLNRRQLLQASAVAAATATGGAVFGPAPAQAATTGCQEVTKLPMPTQRRLTVLLTGDAGTGEETQYAVSEAARKITEATGLDLAVGLGDNIYEMGPSSSCGEDFRTKFEEPNTGLDVPWLMTQGNHDNTLLIPGDGGNLYRGDHEVDYHRHSARWYMPDRYYSVALPAANPIVELFVLDDNPVTSYLFQVDPYYTYDGPFMRAQRAWLDRGLASSRARWKLVLSHHPYINNGSHGSAGSYDGFSTDLPGPLDDYSRGVHFKTLIEEVALGRCDLLLAGHDHSQQILDIEGGGGTQQVVCGASGKVGSATAIQDYDPDRYPAYWQDNTLPGFMLLTVAPDRLVLDAYTVDVATRSASAAHHHTIER